MTTTDRHGALAAALGRIASGLFIVTAHRDKAETGMLASWVQQCAFEPPHLTLALKRGREIEAWLTPDDLFTVNILDDSQTDMLVHFGRGFGLNDSAFAGLEIERSENGDPVLCDALAYLDCRATARYEVGDHHLLIAQVLGGRLLNEGHPMVHVRKNGFHY